MILWGVFSNEDGHADLLSVHQSKETAEARAAKENEQHLMDARVGEIEVEP